MTGARGKVLMACCNHWTSPFQVGSHQLARQFVRLGYEVAFLSDPVSPFHLASRQEMVKERFRIHRSGGLRDLGGRLWAYVPSTLLPPHRGPLLGSAWAYHSWSRFTFPDVVEKVRRAGFGRVDLLYLDSEVQAFWLKALQARRRIFRVTDAKEGFGRTTPAYLQMRRETVQAVDLVVYSGRTLEPLVAGLSPKRMAFLPNGVDFAHFAGPKGPCPEEYRPLPGPRVVYVGAQDYWFDHDALALAARQLPGVSFILIGPRPAGALPPDYPSNVHWLGPRPYDRLPAYLKWADVGIIPNNVRDHSTLVHHMNPLKLHQYLACGLPVVAVRSKEMEDLGSPARLYEDAEGFVRALRRTLERPGDPRARKSYARRQDWSGRARTLLAGLGSKRTRKDRAVDAI